MDICGEGDAVTRDHLLRLASVGGVSAKAAHAMIEQVLAQTSRFAQRASALPIRKATVQPMNTAIQTSAARLANNAIKP